MICDERRTQKKNSELQMGIEPMTFCTLVGCSKHWATENSVVSRSVVGWHNYHIAQSHCVKWTHNTGCKESHFTACHLGKLKLAVTNPDIISASPQIFWWAELISKLRTEFTGPTAKFTCLELSDTTFFARCNTNCIAQSCKYCMRRREKNSEFQMGIYRFHRFISEDTSVLLFIQKWKLISSKKWICWQLSCNWESKDQTIITFLKLKKFLKRSYLFFKTRFKIFVLMASIGQVCRLPIFRDLGLPPFQNNIGVVVVGRGGWN